MTQTIAQRHADLRLGRSVIDDIKAKRDQGLSWRRIARELATETDGDVDVTDVTLRRWMSEADAA